MVKLHAKCQCIVVSSILSFHRVLIVADISTSSVPTFAASFSFNFWIYHWTHSVIIKRIRLHHVNDIEPVCLSSPRVSNAEIVPLGISSCVIIWFENKIVFEFIYLNRTAQVATLKSWLKDQCVIIFRCRTVERKELSLGWLHPLCIRWRVLAIIYHTIHSALLVSHTFRLSPQAILQNEFLGRIQWLEIDHCSAVL